MKYRFILCFLFLFTIANIANAQLNIEGKPISWKNSFKIEDFTVIEMLALDIETILMEDEEDEKFNRPPRFGYKHKVNLNLENSGTWKELSNGDKIWILNIKCPDALSVNFLFDKFWIPVGGVLHIYSKDKKHLIGGFTEKNNKGNENNPKGFGTGLVYGSDVILEYFQPQSSAQKPILSLTNIVHGYRYIKVPTAIEKKFGESGECQVNIKCLEGDDWQDEKKGVALILVDGNRWCSGSLVNNTNQDGRLLFLTANHCIDGFGDAVTNPDLSDYSFLWNYESPNCSNPSSEPNTANSFTNGAIVLANSPNSDFALLELVESPFDLSPIQEVFFNGWNRSTNLAAGGVGIHHPMGDIKKISTYTMTPIGTTTCNSGSSDFWEVSWIETVTNHSVMQPASSGSPLFNNDLIIGQLFGPFFCPDIQCEDPSAQRVVYGRISSSWNNGGTTNNARRLSPWLDPANTEVMELQGGYLDLCVANRLIDFPLNNNALIQADNEIIASNEVLIPDDTEMRAGVTVKMVDGFKASDEFKAYIHPCEMVVLPPLKKNQSTGGKIKEPNEEAKSYSINVYPNPTTNQITIESSKSYHLNIFNMMGQQVGQENGNTKMVQYDMTKFEAGIYIFQFRFEDGTMETIRVIKQ